MALRSLKVLEMAGLAPVPFCGMLLSDFGASVVCVDRPQEQMAADRLTRGKRSIVLNLAEKGGVEALKRLSQKADVLLEGYRPGVMEKLGVGPKTLLGENPSLIYARLSGFGQDGPWAKMAGHDINYVALSGFLSALGGSTSKPMPPINFLADFAGGGLLCAFGILAAVVERSKTGLGQIVDNSMTEGTAYLSSWIWRTRLAPSSEDLVPLWPNSDKREENLLDGGANFYQTYATSDGKYMAVGALEPKFHSVFLKGLGLDPEEHPQFPWNSPKTSAAIRSAFASKTQAEWTEVYKNTDACVTPVLSMLEAAENEHNAHRASFLRDSSGVPFPAPAPRLSRTPATINGCREPQKGEHTKEVLTEYGFTNEEIEGLLECNYAQQLTKSKL